MFQLLTYLLNEYCDHVNTIFKRHFNIIGAFEERVYDFMNIINLIF